MNTSLIKVNLGSGTYPLEGYRNLDGSPLAWLAERPWLLYAAKPLVGTERWHRLRSFHGSVQYWRAEDGLPFPDRSVDAVYHCHFLEHLPRRHVPALLREIHRVMKPGGVHRVVVPDLEVRARRYLMTLARGGPEHERNVGLMLGQMALDRVQRVDKGPRAWLERMFFADARARLWVHRWMYDRINLGCLLEDAGFVDVRVLPFSESNLPDWDMTWPDGAPDQGARRPWSLYLEGVAAH